MKIILAAITLLAFPLSASAECTVLNDEDLEAIITQRVTECLGNDDCSFLGTFLGMPDISPSFSSHCKDLGGMVFYSNAYFVDGSCALPEGLPDHSTGLPLCMSTVCTNEETEVFAHEKFGTVFGTACTAAIDVYTFPDEDDVSIQCAADMARILFNVYDTPEWKDHIVIDTNNEFYVWNGSDADLAEFTSICESYYGRKAFGNAANNCSPKPEGFLHDYQNVPFCAAVACSDLQATDVVSFVITQVLDCPVVASINPTKRELRGRKSF